MVVERTRCRRTAKACQKPHNARGEELEATGIPNRLALLPLARQSASLVQISTQRLRVEPINDQVRKGYFNGLIVAAFGVDGGQSDVVSQSSSHGPAAWLDALGNPVVSKKDGVSFGGPGGYVGPPITTPFDPEGDPMTEGLNLPFADESYSQSLSFGRQRGYWTITNQVGTSIASPWDLSMGAA